MSRSQLALQTRQGFDSAGRCAYERGVPSRVTPSNQWARARQRGYLPPALSPHPVFTVSAAAGTTTMQAVLTFDGAGAPAGTLVLVTWGAGATPVWYTLGGGPISNTFATEGERTITATIGGRNQTATFTAAEPE